MSDDLQELQKRQEEFINNRNWSQFHTPKSLAMAISIEASELMELFLWHDNLPSEAYSDESEIQEDVEEELADIVIYSLSMACAFNLDLSEAVDEKLEKNEERFNLAKSEEIREELSKWKCDDSN